MNKNTRHCPRCGEEIAEGSQFCTYCGAKIDLQPKRQPVAKKKINKKWIIIAIAAVAAVVAIILTTTGGDKENPTEEQETVSLFQEGETYSYEQFVKNGEKGYKAKSYFVFYPEKHFECGVGDVINGEVKVATVSDKGSKVVSGDVMLMMATPKGVLFPVVCLSWFPRSQSEQFVLRGDGDRLYYDEFNDRNNKTPRFNIDYGQKTAKLDESPYDRSCWSKYYNSGETFTLTKETGSFVSSEQLVGTSWDIVECSWDKNYKKKWWRFKSNAEVVVYDGDYGRDFLYTCIGNKIAVRTNNLIASSFTGVLDYHHYHHLLEDGYLIGDYNEGAKTMTLYQDGLAGRNTNCYIKLQKMD